MRGEGWGKGGRNFLIFWSEKYYFNTYMVWTWKDFCEKNGPNLPNFYNKFQLVAKIHKKIIKIFKTFISGL